MPAAVAPASSTYHQELLTRQWASAASVIDTQPPVQADDLVVGLQGCLLQGGEHACGDPLVVSALDGGCRVGGVGDLLIVRPRHQSLDELVEDDLFRGAGSVIPQRVGIDVDR